MLIYGLHAVDACLNKRASSIRTVYFAAERMDARAMRLSLQIQKLGIRSYRVDRSRLDQLCQCKHHQGVVAIVEDKAAVEGKIVSSLKELLSKGVVPPARFLILDGVTDPRNLGACLRVADGAGALAVVAPKDRSCPLTDVVMKAASGAAEHVPYLMETNLARAMDALREAGVCLIGADGTGGKSLYGLRLPSLVGWVLGSEGKGLRRLTRERCDYLVSIPMKGSVSSLNVSVAAGILLYESVGQTEQGIEKAKTIP